MQPPCGPARPHAVALRTSLCTAVCSLKMYNNLVERCFRECAEDMRSKTLSAKEEQVGCKQGMLGRGGAGASQERHTAAQAVPQVGSTAPASTSTMCCVPALFLCVMCVPSVLFIVGGVHARTH